jgi:hypothetical protein
MLRKRKETGQSDGGKDDVREDEDLVVVMR